MSFRTSSVAATSSIDSHGRDWRALHRAARRAVLRPARRASWPSSAARSATRRTCRRATRANRHRDALVLGRRVTVRGSL
jgi:hypothetical protein